MDDDPFILAALGDYLNALNVEHECYNSPTEALEVFENSLNKKCCNVGFTLVMTDIQMPDMDGHLLAENMFKLQKEKNERLGQTK